MIGFRQPDGRCVTDEVDVVAARGQFHPQFRSDHTRAAVGWVTGDPNLHVHSSAWLVCSSEMIIAGKTIHDARADCQFSKQRPSGNSHYAELPRDSICYPSTVAYEASHEMQHEDARCL